MTDQSGFISLFDQHAACGPDDLAVIASAGTLSYGMLCSHINRLARQLAEQGIGPGAIVGICLDRSPLLVVALLGALKAGAAYVAIDPGSPRHRLDFVLDDTDPDLVLTEERFAPKFRDRAPALFLDRDWHRIAAQPSAPLGRGIDDRSLAYLVYTSGSTGMPKSVEIEHRGIAPLLRWAKRAFGGALHRVLAASSLSFDMSVFEIFAPLCAGGAVVLADSVLRLRESPAAEELTLISTVPAMLDELALSGGLPESLACVLVAGEPLTEPVIRRTFAGSRVDRIWNLYGVSEDTIYSTAAMLSRDSSGPVTIGSPLPERAVVILDNNLDPVRQGGTGELYVSGAGVARGYHGRPALTAERFLPHPTPAVPGQCMYRTGDLGRQRTDGMFECLGRADRQLKIRGHRIEPGEIEAAIDAFTGSQSIVVLQRDREDMAHLVAHVVCREGTLDLRALREHLRSRLSPWMMPSVIRQLSALPLTVHGKVDRAALAGSAGGVSHDRADSLFRIVVNAESRYSIWPAGRVPPLGWTSVSGPRPRQECLALIEQLWTGTGGASVRRSVVQAGADEPLRRPLPDRARLPAAR